MMTNEEKERLWSAYIDGELTAAEAARFEDSLPDVERQRLTAESRFERGLAERLSAPVTCPERLWEDTRAAVVRHDNARQTKPSMSRWIVGLGGLAAAMLIAVVFVGPQLGEPALASVLQVNDWPSEVPVPESAVEDYFGQRNIQLHLNHPPPDSGVLHHPMDLLGAAPGTYNGDEFVQVYARCCGKPVKLVVAPSDSALARKIEKPSWRRQVQEVWTVGDYTAILVGNHRARPLLDALSVK